MLRLFAIENVLVILVSVTAIMSMFLFVQLRSCSSESMHLYETKKVTYSYWLILDFETLNIIAFK